MARGATTMAGSTGFGASADGSGGDPLDDGIDFETDGVCDAGDLDADNDGIPDADETTVGVDPDGDTWGDSGAEVGGDVARPTPHVEQPQAGPQ